jgi:hypothetical protein
MKKLLISLAILLLVTTNARAQTSPSCSQLPNLTCAAGDTISGTFTFDDNVTQPFILEGATADVNETIIAVTDPTNDDNTITIPDITGTLVTTGDTDTVDVTMLKDTDAPGDEECATYESTGSTIEWQACASAAVWTDLGTVVHISTGTGDDVALGNTSLVNSSKLSVDGDADQVQLTLQGNGTQTDSIMIVETSAGTEVFNIDASGNVLAQSLQDIDGPGTNWSLTAGGVLTIADDLTVSGGDITLGATAIFSGGDTASLDNLDAIDATTETTLEGAIDIAGDVAGTGLTAVTIQADAVEESMLKAVDAAVDEDILTYESTTGDFEWHTTAEIIGAGALANVLAWNEKACLTADCSAPDTPCDCCTGASAGCSAGTFTLAGTPRVNCSAGNDDGGGTITAMSNGITMKCVTSCGGIDEFSFSGTTWTPCDTDNTPAYITYEQ